MSPNTMTTGDRVLQALQAYDLKREPDGEWRSNSPLRPGSNSHAFAVTIDTDGEHGAYIDHVSNDSGTLYDLAERLGIALPDVAPAVATKRAFSGLADYAAAHGITADVLKAAGWSDIETKGGRPALAFKTKTGTRYRFLDGEKPYYKSDMGYKACLYGLTRALQIADETWMPLVLTNGEVSTVTAQHYGIPAFCVTGGEKKLPPALLEELKTQLGQRVLLIALDCDKTGRDAAAAIKAQLTGHDVTVIDLGLGDAGDLADFCKLHGKNAPQALTHRQTETPLQETPSISVGVDLGPLAAAAQALSSAMRLDAKARKQADIEMLCAQVQGELDRVRLHTAAPSILSFAQVANDNMTLLDWLIANPDPIQGLRSRIAGLDKTIGGFAPEVYVLYGATSMGKSWLAVSLCREFITQGAGLIVPTESRPGRWLFRLAASLCKVPADLIETGQLTPQQQKDVKRALDQLKDLKCDILSNGSPTPAQVRAAVLRGMAANDYKWLIVDSASKMAAPGTTSIYDRTTAVSDGLQSLYQEVNIPIICTSQVGRDVADRSEGKKMPQLEDGYGGGVIEHNAGCVVGLYRHQYYVEKGLEKPRPEFPENMTLAKILKNRWRQGGGNTAVKLAFIGGSGFYEMETRHA